MYKPVPRSLLFTACTVTFLLSGCGGFSVWPFGDSKDESPTNRPANSTEYNCDAGKKFYVRNTDTGVWLILSDREVGLVKSADGRYSNGITTLAINGKEAELELTPTSSYKNCKLPEPVAAPKP